MSLYLSTQMMQMILGKEGIATGRDSVPNKVLAGGVGLTQSTG